MKTLSSLEYKLTISKDKIVEIMELASSTAHFLNERNAHKDSAIIEKRETRTVTIPTKFLGITIGHRYGNEPFDNIMLSGWLLFQRVVLMGEDERDKEWYQWTLFYYLGEDGILYSRKEEITEHYQGSFARTVDLLSAVKVESIYDFVKSDETKTTEKDGFYYTHFGGSIENSLNSLRQKHCN